MMRILFLFCWLCYALVAACQPASEIFLFDLQLKKDNIALRNGKNITNHKGYDNQPFFHPRNPLMYYTAADSTGRTDIFAYDFKADKTIRITKTNEREFSPTITPDGQFLSCIIQRDNGAQDLGQYPIAGGSADVIVNNLIVGYHAWLNENVLILFVLGETPTLRKFTIDDRSDSIIAENISRSLHRIPGTKAVSFIQKHPGDWFIKKIENNGRSITTISKTIQNGEDLAWTPDGRILMGQGSKLYVSNPGRNESWKEVVIETTLPLKGITRIAVSPKGDKIAIVVEE